MQRANISAVICAILLALPSAAQITERVNAEATTRFKAESARQSQLMDIASTLTNTHGARLTNSPSIRAAGEYVRQKLVSWRLDDVRLEPWNFGNGWTNEKFAIRLVSDPGLTLLAYPKAWTPGTQGPVTAEIVEAVIRTEEDFARLRGTLRGKFALILAAPSVPATQQTELKRFTDAELFELAGAPEASAASAATAPAEPAPADDAPEAETGFFAWVENALSAAPAQPVEPVRPAPRQPSPPRITRERVTTFYLEEGVAAMIEPGPVRGGAVLAVTATGETNPWKKDPKAPKVPPQVVIAAEQYRKIMELAQGSTPVTMELEIQNASHVQDMNAFNVVADIKGTDKADEFVVLGAHLDSWHLGKGATDNAAGVAVVMEAMRILKTAALPMRRTVRLGIWTGEEQGLLGSRAFVDRYFINRPIYQTKAAHSKLSAYFNVDNGTGAIRGIYTQQNNDVVPIFQAWMAPLRDLGVTTVSNRNAPSTDHVAFDGSGLPGFQFIQDPIEYQTRTHHTNEDTFDRLLKDDLVKNAAIVASFVYHAANRDEPLPRKPLPRSIRPAGSPVP